MCVSPRWRNKGTSGWCTDLDAGTQHYPVAEIFQDSSWVENILLMFSILAVVL